MAEVISSEKNVYISRNEKTHTIFYKWNLGIEPASEVYQVAHLSVIG